jgi:hypothetical protein
VHAEDPETENSSSFDLLDPPQGILLLVGWFVPAWESTVAQHLHDHDRHAHHISN